MSKQSNKSVSQRRDQIIESWRQFAADSKFATLTLAEFEVESRKPLDLRERMRALQTELKGLKIQRDLADGIANDLFVAVANSVRGDHGLNSPLYRSLGFVPKSERKRPLRATKTDGPEANPPVDAGAA